MPVDAGRPSAQASVTHVAVGDSLSTFLDFFRWLSALIVVVGHSRAIFFVPWPQVEHRDIVSTALYFVSGWGDYGVMMFFAISGFLIGGGVYQAIPARRFSFATYFINRFTRIYIVLVPALLLVWILNVIGLTWLNGSGIYTKGYPIGALGLDTSEAIGVGNFLVNIFMLQNLLGPPFGTAQPLWSLNWEWWSYMVAPLLFGLLIRVNGRSAVALWTVLAIGATAVGLRYAVLWQIGSLLVFLRFRSLPLLVASALICLFLPVITRAEVVTPGVVTQFMFTTSFVFLLSQLRHTKMPNFWRRFPHTVLANFSYSLYVMHTTIIVFIMANMQTFSGYPRQLQPGLGNYGRYFILLAIVFSLAFLFAKATEANTSSLRRFISRQFSLRPVDRSKESVQP